MAGPVPCLPPIATSTRTVERRDGWIRKGGFASPGRTAPRCRVLKEMMATSGTLYNDRYASVPRSADALPAPRLKQVGAHSEAQHVGHGLPALSLLGQGGVGRSAAQAAA